MRFMLALTSQISTKIESEIGLSEIDDTEAFQKTKIAKS